MKTHLNELQDKVSVFAVEFGGQAVQASSQPVLVDLHQLLAFGIQFHTDSKLVFPVTDNKWEETEEKNKDLLYFWERSSAWQM